MLIDSVREFLELPGAILTAGELTPGRGIVVFRGSIGTPKKAYRPYSGMFQNARFSLVGPGEFVGTDPALHTLGYKRAGELVLGLNPDTHFCLDLAEYNRRMRHPHTWRAGAP